MALGLSGRGTGARVDPPSGGAATSHARMYNHAFVRIYHSLPAAADQADSGRERATVIVRPDIRALPA